MKVEPSFRKVGDVDPSNFNRQFMLQLFPRDLLKFSSYTFSYQIPYTVSTRTQAQATLFRFIIIFKEKFQKPVIFLLFSPGIIWNRRIFEGFDKGYLVRLAQDMKQPLSPKSSS